ncbi:hypothetical protein H634G_08584 [Metarhizium anisopliae BRIP 53293]|uniref:Uncharacterized protein n=1 Tax=Metarhizium anisopliae BRIP 53293 TaxID=1291518 RepID=A0A0D9NQZ6_METAN|nr:hypothetical protein H634G_08584 [Metarhizium anisopliae BRIP 53293]KJK90989.1 hypothetical protein H633G_05158 [Metarhizium anisopliae BRIP 53284]
MAKRVEMDEVSNEASSNGDLVDMKHEPQFDGVPWLPKSSQVSKMLHTLLLTDFQEYSIRGNLTMPQTKWNYFALKVQDSEDPEPANGDGLRRIYLARVERIYIFPTISLRHQDGYLQVLLDRVEPHVSVSRASGSLDAVALLSMNLHVYRLGSTTASQPDDGLWLTFRPEVFLKSGNPVLAVVNAGPGPRNQDNTQHRRRRGRN